MDKELNGTVSRGSFSNRTDSYQIRCAIVFFAFFVIFTYFVFSSAIIPQINVKSGLSYVGEYTFTPTKLQKWGEEYFLCFSNEEIGAKCKFEMDAQTARYYEEELMSSELQLQVYQVKIGGYYVDKSGYEGMRDDIEQVYLEDKDTGNLPFLLGADFVSLAIGSGMLFAYRKRKKEIAFRIAHPEIVETEKQKQVDAYDPFAL